MWVKGIEWAIVVKDCAICVLALMKVTGKAVLRKCTYGQCRKYLWHLADQ
jgi:hypothetical protein